MLKQNDHHYAEVVLVSVLVGKCVYFDQIVIDIYSHSFSILEECLICCEPFWRNEIAEEVDTVIWSTSTHGMG